MMPWRVARVGENSRSEPNAVLIAMLLDHPIDGIRSGDGPDAPWPRLPAASGPLSSSLTNGCMLSQMPLSAISLAVASSIRWPCSMHPAPAAIARWIASGV